MMFFKSKKKTRELQQATSEPSYVARDTSLEGNLICDGEIHIDGAVRGSVRAHTCLVDNNGEVHGEITAEIVYVRGRVIGPVTGTHVFIHASAHVEGNVTNEPSALRMALIFMAQSDMALRHINLRQFLKFQQSRPSHKNRF
jgi:cytoskeletal protein CcmA (bactofilin family)